MRFSPLLLLVSLSAAFPCLGAAQSVARTPADSTPYWTFLETLAGAWTPLTRSGGYDPKKAGPWDASKISSLLSTGGVDFEDPNDSQKWHTTLSALRREIGRRKGRSFDVLLHLGFIRSQPYSQYSELAISQVGDTIVTKVGDSYELASLFEDGLLKVFRIRYLHLNDL